MAEKLPSCYGEYTETTKCDKCPLGSLCLEQKEWDDADSEETGEEIDECP
jgi:hypothetical protein